MRRGGAGREEMTGVPPETWPDGDSNLGPEILQKNRQTRREVWSGEEREKEERVKFFYRQVAVVGNGVFPSSDVSFRGTFIPSIGRKVRRRGGHGTHSGFGCTEGERVDD